MSELVVGSLKGLSANNFVIDVASGSQIRQTGAVLQVVTVTKTNTFSTSSTSFTNVTGMSATITPKATNSKILIMVQVSFGLANNNGYGHFRLNGGNTSTYVGDAAGSRIRNIFGGGVVADTKSVMLAGNITLLDSPNTTSAVTYNLQVRQASGGSVEINRSPQDSDDALHGRGASSITLMEIAG